MLNWLTIRRSQPTSHALLFFLKGMPGLNTRNDYVIFGLVESEIGVFHVYENKSEDKAGDCEQAGNSPHSPIKAFITRINAWIGLGSHQTLTSMWEHLA